MSEVFYTDEFGAWFDGLEGDEQEEIDFVVGLLANFGTRLEYPYSSALKAARYAFRELRPKRGRSPLRVVYAFDPHRDEVLILGGDKGAEPKFYKRILVRAEEIWKQYLAEQEAGEHERKDCP